jgi:hypothetical protein
LEKLNDLSNGEKLIAGGGILMVIASFLPWYKVSIDFGEFGGASFSANGWEAPGAIWSILAVLIAVALVGVIAAVRFGNVKLPDLGQFTWGQALLAGGVATVVLVLLKLISESSSMSFGFYLGILAAIAMAAGGYLAFTEEKSGVSRTA